MYEATLDTLDGVKVLSVTNLHRSVIPGVTLGHREHLYHVYFDHLECFCGSSPCTCHGRIPLSDEWLRELAMFAYNSKMQPRTDTIELTFPICGQRVEFLGVVDRGIECYLDLTGRAGTVWEVSTTGIWVKLDNHYSELNEWNNCVNWHCDGDVPNTPCRPSHAINEFDRDVKFLTPYKS